MLKKLFFITFFILNQFAFANDIETYGNFFQAVKQKNAQTVNYKLADFDQQKIKYTLSKGQLDLPVYDYSKDESSIIQVGAYSIERPALDTESTAKLLSYVLNLSFDSLTLQQFSFLKTYYKSSTNMTFDPKIKYNLSDFLPKSAQTVLNKYFITNRETVKKSNLAWFHSLSNDDRSLEVSSTTNCWNAAWEYIRNSSIEYTTFFAPESVVNKYLNSNKYSSEITKLNNTQILNIFYKGQLNSNLQAGDLILIYQKMQSMAQGKFEALSHVAIYLGNGLIFEKTNNNSNNPYRISFLTDAIDNLLYKENSELPTKASDLADTRIVIRRFNKIKLPHAKEALSFMQNDGVFAAKSDIPAALKPNDSTLKSYTLVADIGSGGNILFEYLYKIIDYKIESK